MIITPKIPYKTLLDTYQSFRKDDKFKIQFITGEAGSGKTSLVNLFLDEVAGTDENILIVSGLCYIHSEYNIPYQPFKEVLKELIQDVTREEQLSENNNNNRSRIIKNALSFTAKMVCDHAPDLIGSFIPGASVLNAIGNHFFPEKENKEIDETKILEQYIEVIKAISGKYRIIIFIDDLQWIDNLSVNLLYQLLRGLKNYPVMFVGSFRSTDILSSGQTHSLSKLINEVKISYGNVFIDLDKMSDNEKKSFLIEILNSEPNSFDNEFVTKLFQHTHGNPLFVTELISLLKENNDIYLNDEGKWSNYSDFSLNEYPAKIEGIIQERIGKLEDSLIDTLSHASVQGNHFIAQVLSLTMGQSEKEVLMTLSKTLQKQHNLVNETNCFRNGSHIISKFNFSNYIFRQYLYQELSFSQKMLLHSEIAGILEDIFRNNIEEVASDIAHHYELSGESEKSLKYLKITIESMMQISAFIESDVLIIKCLEIINTLEKTPENEWMAFEMQVKHYLCLRSSQGWGDPQVYELLLFLEQQSRTLGRYEYYAIILFGIWTVHLSKLELETCLEIALENTRVAQETDDKRSEATALISLINTLFWMGDFVKSDEYLHQFSELKNHIEMTQQDKTFYLLFSILVATEKSDVENVSRLKEQLLKEVETNKDPFTQVLMYQGLVWVYFLNEETRLLQEYANKMIAICKKYDFRFYLGIGKIFYAGYLLHENLEEAEKTVDEGYQMLLKANGTDIAAMHSIYGIILCRIYLEGNQYELFYKYIQTIIETSLLKSEKCYLAELYLLQSNYYQKINGSEKAAEFFEKAATASRESGSIRIQQKCNL